LLIDSPLSKSNLMKFEKRKNLKLKY